MVFPIILANPVNNSEDKNKGAPAKLGVTLGTIKNFVHLYGSLKKDSKGALFAAGKEEIRKILKAET